MKRTLVIVSALLLSTACRNKNAISREEPDSETKTSAAEVEDQKHPGKDKAEKKPPQQNKPDQKALPAPADVAAPPSDATKTASGLAYKVLKKGDGKDKPQATDLVEVHYTGWTKDGEMFDSSVTRGKTIHFPLNRVIKGWTEGVQLMTEGSKYRFWIPGNLAYGDTPRGGAPSGQLTFDVELVSFLKAPDDVAAPPSDAKKTASGLAYKVLKEGDGEKPGPESRVLVHYSGWTTDGKMFDTSYKRGRPTPLSVNGVIKGWTEGLQMMQPGAKYRFWIPADLAYGDKPMRPGAPSGPLTFDVELVQVM